MPDSNSCDHAAMRPAAAADFRADASDDADGFRSSIPGQRRGVVWPGLARLEGIVSPAGGSHANCGDFTWRAAVLSGPWTSDVSAIGAQRRAMPAAGPGFHLPLNPGGYACGTWMRRAMTVRTACASSVSWAASSRPITQLRAPARPRRSTQPLRLQRPISPAIASAGT